MQVAALRTFILKELHEGKTGDHLGQEKTLNRLIKNEQFGWPGTIMNQGLVPKLQSVHSYVPRENDQYHATVPITAGYNYPSQIMAVQCSL